MVFNTMISNLQLFKIHACVLYVGFLQSSRYDKGDVPDNCSTICTLHTLTLLILVDFPGMLIELHVVWNCSFFIKGGAGQIFSLMMYFHS